MSLYDLTGNKVSFTYGRLVQIASGSYYDGFGNPLDLSGSGTTIITGSTYPITSSWANNVVSASYSLTSSYSFNSISASYSLTASYSNSSSYAVTASYAANSTNSQNAQDVLVYVKNTTGEIIPKGRLVRIVGVDNSSSNPSITLADFVNDANSANTLGYTNEEFAINGFGYVITEGRLVGIDTSAFTSGDLLYLSSSGTITNVVPTAPKHGVRVGQVIRSQSNNGSIYVTIDNGYELGELHDIVDRSTTGSYGDLLIRSGSVWTNSKSLTGNYTLSGSLITNDGIICNNVTASFYGTSSWSNNSLTASNLTNGNYTITSLTSSNLLVTGTLYASNFSSSTIYITSSEYIVTDNIITLNALNPHKRYAGLELHDSGSNNLSYLLWDSQNNYLFVSSSESAGSRQIILGPDNEVNLISNYIPLISSSNSITSSIIYQNNGNIGIGTTSPTAKVDVTGDIQANAFYGKSFGLTTTTGQSAIFDTFSTTGTGEVYEVVIKGNPNAGESVNYQDVIYGKIIIGTGKTGSIETTFINYVQESPDPRLLYSSGGSSLTASIYFNSASVDVTQKNIGENTLIRVVVGSYAVGYVGNNTTVRLKQIL